MLASMPKVTTGQVLYIESKMMRPNIELFTMDPSLLKLATEMLNRNSKSSGIGRFVADFACNSIKFIIKMLLVNPDNSGLDFILREAAADMKHRLQVNLLNVLLTVG